MNATEIIKHVNNIYKADAGIDALTKTDCCIMDEIHTRYPYKDICGCPDFNKCDDPQYMLACLATRRPEQLSQWVIDTYNTEMDS